MCHVHLYAICAKPTIVSVFCSLPLSLSSDILKPEFRRQLIRSWTKWPQVLKEIVVIYYHTWLQSQASRAVLIILKRHFFDEWLTPSQPAIPTATMWPATWGDVASPSRVPTSHSLRASGGHCPDLHVPDGLPLDGLSAHLDFWLIVRTLLLPRSTRSSHQSSGVESQLRHA